MIIEYFLQYNLSSRATHTHTHTTTSNMVLSHSCVTQANGKTPAGGFKRQADVFFSPCYYYNHVLHFFLIICACVRVCVCMRFISGAHQVTEGTTLITRCRDLSYYYYYYYRLIYQLLVYIILNAFSLTTTTTAIV